MSDNQTAKPMNILVNPADTLFVCIHCGSRSCDINRSRGVPGCIFWTCAICQRTSFCFFMDDGSWVRTKDLPLPKIEDYAKRGAEVWFAPHIHKEG